MNYFKRLLRNESEPLIYSNEDKSTMSPKKFSLNGSWKMNIGKFKISMAIFVLSFLFLLSHFNLIGKAHHHIRMMFKPVEVRFGGKFVFENWINWTQEQHLTRGSITNESLIRDQLEELLKLPSHCKLPIDVNPYDPFIKPYLSAKVEFNCEEIPPLTYVDHQTNILYLNDTSNQCYFSWIKRIDDLNIEYSPEILFPNDKPVQLPDENSAVVVSCYNRFNTEMYRNIHYWIPKFNESKADDVSVAVIAFESLSRLSYIRFMPKTRKFLNDLGDFIIFNGLNKIGANSMPNTMALMAGIIMHDKTADHFEGYWDNKFDYLFDIYKNAGYVTGFNEDMPKSGLFSYNYIGLKDVPTDFYPRPFWLHHYTEGTAKYGSGYCNYYRGPKLKVFLEQNGQFIKKSIDEHKPSFLFSFYNQVTHGGFNHFGLLDESVYNFLNNIKEKLDDLLLVIMGDHGSRMDGISWTPLGHIEVKSPLFGIRIPKKLHKTHGHLQQFLEINQNRLTTYLDIHKMLKDVAQSRFHI